MKSYTLGYDKSKCRHFAVGAFPFFLWEGPCQIDDLWRPRTQIGSAHICFPFVQIDHFLHPFWALLFFQGGHGISSLYSSSFPSERAAARHRASSADSGLRLHSLVLVLGLFSQVKTCFYGGHRPDPFVKGTRSGKLQF